MVDINISLLVPLLLLVTITMTDVSRQIKIVEVSNEVHSEVYLLQGGPVEAVLRPLFDLSLSPGEKASQQKGTEVNGGAEPRFGRFNHIHAFNSLLLGLVLVLTVLSESSLSGVILAVVISVFWMVLPILEVNEYDLMMQHFGPDDPLYSLSFHMIATAILCIPSLVLSYVDMTGYAVLYKIMCIIAYLGASVLIGNIFQSYLRDEINILQEYGVRESI
ncbi:hypothetical protein BRD04_09435 [Halobacteriales archaeon QS_9_67_17]|nr:MAG: hypothetical protein BRD04_09435 [Halobacteriales archaeon QS_9_67_17]